MNIKLQLSILVFLLTFLSCNIFDNKSDNAINFEDYQPPAIRIVRSGTNSTIYNSNGMPIKDMWEVDTGDGLKVEYEDFTFDSNNQRTGSLIYEYDDAIGNFINTSYTTIDHDIDGYETKISYFSSLDDTLESYNEILYTNGVISKYTRFDNLGNINFTREYDSLGRVSKLTGADLYYDDIFIFGSRWYDDQGNQLTIPTFSIKYSYYYNTNLPVKAVVTGETVQASYILSYNIVNGIYKSAVLKMGNTTIYEVLFDEPTNTSYGFKQKASAQLLNTPPDDLLYWAVTSTDPITSTLRISKDYQYLGLERWNHDYEAGSINPKCIPSILVR